jgi:FimV-like protein
MRGRALIIATSRYSDPELSPLPSVTQDAAGLREVLADPRIGGFAVTECRDSPSSIWRERIVEFFSKATADEMLLLYISGHGLKDQPGRLYFAAADTRQDLLSANGIPSNFIHEEANRCRSRRVVMIFDTCFSGAIASGWELKDGSRPGNLAVDVGHYFQEATGRVVIAASDRMQRALAGKGQPSLFSKHLIEGLRTGAADLDGDGEVSSAELVAYVAEQMRTETEAQEPKRWAFELSKGIDLVIASNPAPRAGKLPQELIDLIMSPNAKVRLVAVEELRALVGSAPSVPAVLAARQALERLREDDSKAVSSAAAAVLQQAAEPEYQLAHARESEHQRQATVAPLAKDMRPATAARQAEQEQQAAAARRAEEEKQAEAARKAERERQAAKAREQLDSKLLLARVYIDKGDLDRARDILQEILHDGSDSQKQQAQRLMEALQQAKDARNAEGARQATVVRQTKRWAFATIALLAIAGGVLYSSVSRYHWYMNRDYAPGHRVGESFRDCEDVCPEMVRILAGSFLMGSPEDEAGRFPDEGPLHSVHVPAFAIGKYAVTFDEWDACVGARGCSTKPSDEGWGRGRRPVINVSWDDAQQYVRWLSAKTGHRYRLPSEAEWEYAARAGMTTAYYWGNQIGAGNANCNGCGSQWDNKQTAPVGSFAPNPWGLYDMAGNVWQWTDCYHNSYSGAPPDGSAWEAGDCYFRAIRGGSFSYYPPGLRAAFRYRNTATSTFSGLGFRLARD